MIPSSFAKKGFVIQTLILSKERFDTVEAATSWVDKHGFRTEKVDVTGTSYRFRQRSPDDFALLRTITLTDGVKAVGGPLKKNGMSNRTYSAIVQDTGPENPITIRLDGDDIDPTLIARIARVIPQEMDGRLSFIYGDMFPDEPTVFSTNIGARELKGVLHQSESYPLFITKNLKGIWGEVSVSRAGDVSFTPSDIRFDESVVRKRLPTGVYNVIFPGDGTMHLIDVLEFKGEDFSQRPFGMRVDIMESILPPNRLGPIFGSRFTEVANPSEAISPVVIFSRMVDSTGAFIGSSDGNTYQFINNEGIFSAEADAAEYIADEEATGKFQAEKDTDESTIGRFERPAVSTPRDFQLRVDIAADGNISYLLSEDNSLIRLRGDNLFKSDGGADIEQQYRERHLPSFLNRIKSGTIIFDEAEMDGELPGFVIDEGTFTIGVIDTEEGFMEVFYAGGILDGRFIQRFDGDEWTLTQAKGLPLTMRPETKVPPFGFSGLPACLEPKIPDELRYWRVLSRSERTVKRDELITAFESGHIGGCSQRVSYRLSRQTYSKPVRTSRGAMKEYRHLELGDLHHFFIFNGGHMSRINSSNPLPLGKIPLRSQFNTTDASSTIEMEIPEGEATLYADFPDFKVVEFHDGTYRGVWVFELMDEKWEMRRTGGARSRTAGMLSASFAAPQDQPHNPPRFLHTVEKTTPNYIIVSGPAFAFGRLTDGHKRTDNYTREEVRKAAENNQLVPDTDSNLPYVNLYHLSGEISRVGVIMEVWWEDDFAFDYKDVFGVRHNGVGMVFSRYLVQEPNAIKLILEGGEQSISMEPVFEPVENPADPDAPFATEISFRAQAITPNPMIEAAEMEIACVGSTCWKLKTGEPVVV